MEWHIVEEKINEEIIWLKNTIPVFNSEDKYDVSCDCFYRKIALLIITGLIKVREVNALDNGCLWGNLKNNNVIKIHKHGSDWHQGMMNILDNYFKNDGYEVVTEPTLNFGRADLGLFRASEIIYVEVGTTSIKKLYVNLSTLKNATILLVPREEQVIEFIL